MDRGRLREVRTALARKDVSSLERLVGALAPPPHIGEALLALPALFGRAEVLERAARFARNVRSERALSNLSEVHRLLTIYGLADAVLLDLGSALQRKMLRRLAGEIFMYRLMQFWGAYRGNHMHRRLSRARKEQYFYPK